MSNRKLLIKETHKLISVPDASIKLLGQEYIRIYKSMDEPSYSRFLVPPSTPKEVYFDNVISSVPDTFPKLKDVRLPIVRMIGVKATIETLAQYFKCPEYKLNLLQFWFLDMLTDCLWRAQDDYQFPEAQQKVILEWIVFFFKLIKAKTMNLSRKKVLRIFNEAMYLAENLVETGAETIPSPEHLFTINTMAFDEGGGDGDSLLSEEFLEDQDEYLVITSDKQTEVYRLPKRTEYVYTEDECLSSSVETSSEKSYKGSVQEVVSTDSIHSSSEDEFRDFYKADMSTPPRFKSSENLSDESESSELIIEIQPQTSNETLEKPVWKLVPRMPRGPCPSRILQVNKELTERQPTEAELEEKALQAWYEYYLWQLRKDQLDNERLSTLTDEISQIDDVNETEQVRKGFLSELKTKSVERTKTEEDMFINSCVLMAIKEFFVDYFYESFQFDIIRLAYRTSHYLLTQELNKEWKIPKVFKTDLKRPLSKKKKKGKQAKENKRKDNQKQGKKKGETADGRSPKKSTKVSKGTKSTKSSSRTDHSDKTDKKNKKVKEKKKKGSVKDKKEEKEGADRKDRKGTKGKKDNKDKKDKGSKKGKKSETENEANGKHKKKRKKTVVEKGKQRSETILGEILLQKDSQKFHDDEILKPKQQEEAEQKRKEEENKKFLFPLTKAVNDQFFQGVFEDWTRPQPKGKKDVSTEPQTMKPDSNDIKAKKKHGSEKSSGKRDRSEGKKKKKKK